jgi:hypothetical protein
MHDTLKWLLLQLIQADGTFGTIVIGVIFVEFSAERSKLALEI